MSLRVSRLQFSVVSLFCDTPMLSHGGRDYYTDVPQQAMREIELLAADLVKGFRVLESRLSAASPTWCDNAGSPHGY
jgi:hypothetical protein